MRKIALLLPILLMACTAPAVPVTPQQIVYHLKSDYIIAQMLEDDYSRLPRCGKPWSPKICSDVKILRRVQKADDLAGSAIKEAQIAVRTPGYGDSGMTTAIASAKALTNAFTEFTENLPKKED